MALFFLLLASKRRSLSAYVRTCHSRPTKHPQKCLLGPWNMEVGTGTRPRWPMKYVVDWTMGLHRNWSSTPQSPDSGTGIREVQNPDRTPSIGVGVTRSTHR
ncbi:hypothetical protein BOTBODRAFT_28553 [Botryobasidium botryosum FD-172 SS1]|uniref:Secreted protein n=1 Tax=Botryobasidium botryosum (strain FD-172 SS1) TaxID=930990 RepID=A0A067MTH8_BOTB1|nr:hypothetical protein BOTBODRAFT_28553 [Botryobasidium botryosum FD-172 SS1]